MVTDSVEIDVKTKLEFLRIATMIGQKIDIIWVTFLTTYITLFGFAIFYDGNVDSVYFVFIIASAMGFTWINGRSLWKHYRTITEMGRVFQEMNSEFPSLHPYMNLYKTGDKKNVLLLTHLGGLCMYCWFLVDKFCVSKQECVDFWYGLAAGLGHPFQFDYFASGPF